MDRQGGHSDTEPISVCLSRGELKTILKYAITWADRMGDDDRRNRWSEIRNSLAREEG